MDKYFSYSINKSNSYSCALNKRKAKKAFDLINKWLEDFPNKNIKNKITCNLTINIINIEIQKKIDDIFKNFGTFIDSGKIQSYPDEVISHYFYRLETEYKYINEILNIYENYYKFLDQSEFCVTFSGYFTINVEKSHLRFVNPNTPKSYFMVSLSKNSIIYPKIYFPFSDINLFLDYYNKIKCNFPFKASDKNLRKHVRKKDSSEYYIRKI